MQLTILQSGTQELHRNGLLGGADDGGYRTVWPPAIEDLITQVQQTPSPPGLRLQRIVTCLPWARRQVLVPRRS